jgi:hypothetical protein
MHHKINLMLLLFFHSSFALDNNNNLNQKFVIGARYAGFFSNFLGMLNIISWCDINKKIPVIYWNEDCLYWENDGYNNNTTNAWEYYFEPVSQLKYVEGDNIYKKYFAPDGSGIKYSSFTCADILSYKLWGNQLIKKYIQIKPQVQKKIDNFYKTHFKNKKIIGIHLRGTDKYSEVKPINPDLIFDIANTYHDHSFFVATDEQKLLDLAKTKLNGPIIYYDAERSNSNKPLHTRTNKAKLGEDVLIEVILLSKCKKLIHTCSNVSCAVLFFNPNLENHLLVANKKNVIFSS